MSADEIKAKAQTLVELYAAVARGKTLQLQTNIGWLEWNGNGGPVIAADLSRWRVKPEPRRMWETPSASSFSNNHNARTYHQDEADKWKDKGCTVTEWQEVLP
jgi:hypothetical protein